MNHISPQSFVSILIIAAAFMLICFLFAIYFGSKLEGERTEAPKPEQSGYGTTSKTKDDKNTEKNSSEKKGKNLGKGSETFKKGATLLEMSKRWKGKSSKFIANST